MLTSFVKEEFLAMQYIWTSIIWKVSDVSLGTKKDFFVAAEATSAAEMIELLKKTTVDILLTDIMMPQMNGFELSLYVRKEFPTIKILALSMSEDGEMIVKMIEQAKVDGYMPKAAGKNELIGAELIM